MVLKDDAASGPDEGNAGPTDSDVNALDAAISQAMGTQTETTAAAEDDPTSTAESTQPAEDAEPNGALADAETQPAAPEGNAAPQHWPADRREAFAKLPADAQKIVSGFVKDLQGGFTRKSQEMADKVRFADSVSSLFSDAERAEMQRYGADDLKAVATLVQLNQFAQRDPVQYIRWAMQHFRVPAEAVVPQQQRGKDQASQQPANEPDIDDLLTDPKVKTLQTELDSIKSYIASQDARAREAAEAQTIGHVNSLKSAIGQFRSSLDDTGNLRYPHFDAVSRAMGALMENHPQLARMPDSFDKLDIAYQMALRADPELSTTVIEAEVAKRLAAEQKRSEAERAKRAGGVKTPLGAPSTRPKVMSLDDAIGAAMSQAGV